MPVGVSSAACLSVWARGDDAIIPRSAVPRPPLLGVLLLKRRSTRLRDAAARPRIEISDEWWQAALVPFKLGASSLLRRTAVRPIWQCREACNFACNQLMRSLEPMPRCLKWNVRVLWPRRRALEEYIHRPEPYDKSRKFKSRSPLLSRSGKQSARVCNYKRQKAASESPFTRSSGLL